MLSGTVGLYDGSDWTDAGPGDCFFVPPGGIHAFRNEPGKPASMLILFTPGAPREAFFVELAEIAASGREPSEKESTGGMTSSWCELASMATHGEQASLHIRRGGWGVPFGPDSACLERPAPALSPPNFCHVLNRPQCVRSSFANCPHPPTSPTR